MRERERENNGGHDRVSQVALGTQPLNSFHGLADSGKRVRETVEGMRTNSWLGDRCAKDERYTVSVSILNGRQRDACEWGERGCETNKLETESRMRFVCLVALSLGESSSLIFS